MSFTDDDLKYLKTLENDGHFQRLRIPALLARLKAAEVCAKHLEDMQPTCRFIEAWRKSCGEAVEK